VPWAELRIARARLKVSSASRRGTFIRQSNRHALPSSVTSTPKKREVDNRRPMDRMRGDAPRFADEQAKCVEAVAASADQGAPVEVRGQAEVRIGVGANRKLNSSASHATATGPIAPRRYH
jgi:hypothetical protein